MEVLKRRASETLGATPIVARVSHTLRAGQTKKRLQEPGLQYEQNSYLCGNTLKHLIPRRKKRRLPCSYTYVCLLRPQTSTQLFDGFIFPRYRARVCLACPPASTPHSSSMIPYSRGKRLSSVPAFLCPRPPPHALILFLSSRTACPEKRVKKRRERRRVSHIGQITDSHCMI